MKNYMSWRRKTNSKGKLFIGALAGAALGFTAGLLAAPRSGKETRKFLSARTNETFDRVGKSLAESTDKAMKGGKEEVDKIGDKLSS